jgi:hypothetical protein
MVFRPAAENRSCLAALTFSATVERTMRQHLPTLAGVLEARRRLSPHLRPTPLYGCATLNELLFSRHCGLTGMEQAIP